MRNGISIPRATSPSSLHVLSARQNLLKDFPKWTVFFCVPTDADFRLAESPAEPDKILEGLPAGATVKIKVRAVNETGPGPFGESVQATLA